MSDFAALLERWSGCLCREVSVGGLIARYEIAHKWKAPYRSLVVREALLWRMHDLGQQILCLRLNVHVLGQRILLRSAIETLALLVYLNRNISSAMASPTSFFEFDDTTKQILMGSKNGSTKASAINILTVLKHAEKQYPGIMGLHERMSESAHPNYDGVLCSYSHTDVERFETHFSNQSAAIFERELEPATALVFEAFEYQYNDVWTALVALEDWLRQNDKILESQHVGI